MYNDYYNNMGMWQNMPKRGVDWGNILNNTQRTLGIINQAIPIVYQVKPLINNAKTMLRVAGAVSAVNNANNVDETFDYNNNYQEKTFVNTNQKDSNGPMFFL